MSLEGVGGDEQMSMGDTGDQSGHAGEGEADAENLKQMLDAAAAEAREENRAVVSQGMGGMDTTGLGMDTTGLGMDTNLDDVLNVADMNPEFSDLDMEGMF